MQELIINQTAKTPLVDFNPLSGVLTLKGRSIPEDSFSFYSVLLDWLGQYLTMPANSTRLIIELEYFNTSSSKFLLELIKKFKAIDTSLNHFVVEWNYESGDEDMLETGKEYMELINLPFILNEI